MKHKLFLFIILLPLNLNAQQFELNFHAAAGLTLVDVGEIMGYEQDEDDLHAYGGFAQVLFGIPDTRIAFGAELGYSRLFYYDYFDGFWSEGNVYSLYPGFLLQYMKRKIYLQSGLDLHVLFNGNFEPITPGVPLGI